MTDLQQLPDNEVEMLTATARDTVAKLEAEAKHLESEAAAAVAAFKAQPNGKTLPQKEIAVQLAENAAAKLAEAITAAQPLIDESTRRAKVQRLHELRAQMEWRGDAEACGARIVEAYAEFRGTLQTQLSVLAEHVSRHNGLLSEVNGLEQYVGNGERHTRVQLDSLMVLVNQRLEARFGSITTGAPEFAQLTSWVNGNAGQVCEVKTRIAAPKESR